MGYLLCVSLLPWVTRAVEFSVGGAAKLCKLCGALFGHKDSKKGHHDSYQWFFEHNHGSLHRYPDTSNVHFGSYGNAASKLLVHHSLYLEFLKLAQDKKTTSWFNHLELNVYRGLKDHPTITELCTFSLYSQAISHPYMCKVRGPETATLNHLDLGPFHVDVCTHMQRIVDTPALLLASNAPYTLGALDGKAMGEA